MNEWMNATLAQLQKLGAIHQTSIHLIPKSTNPHSLNDWVIMQTGRSWGKPSARASSLVPFRPPSVRRVWCRDDLTLEFNGVFMSDVFFLFSLLHERKRTYWSNQEGCPIWSIGVSEKKNLYHNLTRIAKLSNWRDVRSSRNPKSKNCARRQWKSSWRKAMSNGWTHQWRCESFISIVSFLASRDMVNCLL